jgi:hypothetical protein
MEIYNFLGIFIDYEFLIRRHVSIRTFSELLFARDLKENIT